MITHKPVCEQDDVTVLWYEGLHTDREVTAKRPDINIKRRKETTNILIAVTKLETEISCTRKDKIN
jgi:hypothetical protein